MVQDVDALLQGQVPEDLEFCQDLWAPGFPRQIGCLFPKCNTLPYFSAQGPGAFQFQLQEPAFDIVGDAYGHCLSI